MALTKPITSIKPQTDMRTQQQSQTASMAQKQPNSRHQTVTVKKGNVPTKKVFMKNGMSAELLQKDDTVKICLDDSLMIMNPTGVCPGLNKKIGKIVSEVKNNEDDVFVRFKSSDEVVKVPKIFCALSAKVYKSRLSALTQL